MRRTRLSKRIMSMILCIALLMAYIPLSAAAAMPASIITDTVVDPGTADTWETMMGTDADGNRYAGRVWVDKSVYKNGDTVKLNSKNAAGSTFTVSLEDDEAFQIVFSALGSTMTTTSTVSSTGPMDVVLVLDTSTSMDDEDSQGVTRLQRTIEAANLLLSDLLTLNNVRIAIVTYNKDSETVLPLAVYNNGIKLVVTDYYNNGSSDAGVVTAYDKDNKALGKDSGYTQGTNLQSGIDRGFNILANAQNVDGRIPVAIVLTDGQANRASQEGFYEISTHNDKDGTSASNRNLYLSTLLNAAYTKTKIEAHYGKDATVYTVGVDVTNNKVARLLMNPADATNGFNQSNKDNEIKRAYENFQKWARGENVTYSNWSFDHNYPKQGGAITDAKIAANIHYADTYYDVSNAELESTFQQIYEELSSGVFNPISSSTSVEGGTGVDDTPLIYVDFIGQHMQVKEIQAVSLFGASYGVVKNADGTYTVDMATGTNPTTNEAWNTSKDILITVTEQTDGTQKLEIKINQEILPIIMEQVVSETVGTETNATITEIVHDPLRVYYTVGVDSEILLPNGKVDVSKIQGYQHIDDANGTVSFYSNRFGVVNPADSNGVVVQGDAHVGFRPSSANRYYYHQNNQGIFTKITSKSNGSTVTIPENEEYGIVWDETLYDLTWMSYADYQTAKDTDKVYTYVTYYHPTPSATDAANAAEMVTYLVYTDWAYLKESVTFYDSAAGQYLNGGAAVAQDKVTEVINAYRQSNPNAEIYAVLGVGAVRTSRLHNMIVAKAANSTQTAVERYTPEYTHDTASEHNGNDVVVWLGNNGKLTVNIDTGIALTKNVTEAIGNADDTYALTVTVEPGVVAKPVVMNADGKDVTASISTYLNNVLTVNLEAGQTVYISGIPGGTKCTIGENFPSGADYYIAEQTYEVTIPTVSQALNGSAQFAPAFVTNAPNKYGNLYITKEIESSHPVPDSVLGTSFEVTVDLGAALAGKTLDILDSDHADAYKKTVDANGKLVFQIKAMQTVEILHLPAGTAATVTETTPGAHFAVSYRTRNHSGENADTDNAVVIPADGSATAVVINTYTPNATSVDLDIAGTKNYIAEGAHTGGSFQFAVEKWNGTTWEKIIGKTAEVTYGANESGIKFFTIEDVLAGITYTEVGTHSYQVLEVKGNVDNVTYDRTLYTFDVTVTDNGGQLVAAVTDLHNTVVTDGSYEVLFTNTYHTAPVSLDIKKIIDNKSGDDTVSAAGFEFKAVRTDANGVPLTGADAASFSVYSDAAGTARFTSVCTKAGVYHFTLTEVNKGAPGWSYSGAVYRVVVTVEESNGNLIASVDVLKQNSTNEKELVTIDPADASKATVTFVNTYDPEDAAVNLDGAVTKELTGKKLEPKQFTFYVYNDGDRTAPVVKGENDLNGNVKFVDFEKALTFKGVGKYAYDIVEAIPGEAVYDPVTGKYVLNGMYYDPTIYDLVVEVVNDPATGKLAARYYFEDAVTNVVTYRNMYKATPTAYTLGGVKILEGRAHRAGEFTFELYEGDTRIETVTNKADGTFTFAPISYAQAGTYTYTIKEAQPSVKAPGVSYEGINHPVEVKVTVTDDHGVLSASANVSNANIQFRNTYSAASAQLTFNGTKTLKGGTLTDNTFSFNLYKTDHTFDITKNTVQLLATAQNVDGAFSFTRTLSATGTYFFVIAEDAADPVENVVYDRTQYQFVVRVSDVGDGQLKAVVTNVNTGVSGEAAASVTANVAFTNATFDEVTEKEVYIAGSTTTQIDGKQVNAGDILTYFITYTNYTGEDVVVDILDTIPAHTSYVEGSASHNGTYAGTHVNWVLNVERGSSVTVSFNVKVDQTDAIVANIADVRDGVNTYKTNEVVNHTVENELVKDVIAPADPTVSIDGKKVYEGDELVYKVSFTNTTGSVQNLKITDVIPANTTYVAGSADNGGVFEDGKLVWNTQNVPAWATVSVAFKVTVNTKIGAVTIQNQATATDGTNNYKSEWVTNYTVEDEVKKNVFVEGKTDVSVDGKKVNAGDTLVYSISYKNTDTQKVTVTITDKIPANTAYVDGSADNGGVYADGVINWTLDVDAGAAVTVTFKVKVADAENAAAVNKAEVKEGRNTYTTNEVTTEITKPVVPTPDPVVPTPDPVVPTPNPQTGDEANLYSWFTLLFISCGGFLVTALYGWKKKETEENG